jgi:hypothetical protein
MKRKGNIMLARTHLPKHFKTLVQLKRKAWPQWNTHPSKEIKVYFNTVSRHYRSVIRLHQADYESTVLASGAREFQN